MANAPILITGGAGFIGSHLTDALLAKGYAVRVLDDLSTGKRSNLPQENPLVEFVEGDVAMKIRQYLPTGNIGHFQIAGVPERHEPDVGEINYSYLFQLLDKLGWDGWIGCEYRPARGNAPHGTSDGLGWLQPWLQANAG